MSERFWGLVLKWVMMPILGLMTIALIAVVICLPFEIYQRSGERDRLMQECLTDGNAEYVCYGLLRGRPRR